MHPVLTRQIHLDFHTAGDIAHVGGNFEKRQFQEALQGANVNWINLFAKCHHGYSYYPTQVGLRHPCATSDDLLNKQIEACLEIGVRCPIYFTVGWSVADSTAHPEWTARLQTGEKSCYAPVLYSVDQWMDASSKGDTSALKYQRGAAAQSPKPLCSWDFLCPSGEYAQLIYAQTQELVDMFDVHGFFYDIVGYGPCFCNNCLIGMREEGVDCDDVCAVKAYNARMWKQFFRRCKEILHAKHPKATLFFNGTTHLYSGGDLNAAYDMCYHTFYDFLHEENTQQELEDLPSTWGGYDKLPLRAKLFSKTKKPLLAMSGKFHTAWGEFGGIKSADALKYEVASMVAFGAHCNFGDQLHPEGRMDLESYKRIGVAFDYAQKYEEFIDGSKPCSKLALYYSGSQADDEGVASMLLESQIDFEVAAEGYPLDDYEVMILTGGRCVDRDEAKRIGRWLEGGGKLLILGEGALGAHEDVFLFDVGLSLEGESSSDVDYVKVEDSFQNDALFRGCFLFYTPALHARVRDAQVLSKIHKPYYNRTYEHYCSHRHYPYRTTPSDYVGAVRKNNIVYATHNVGKNYHRWGAKVHKDYFLSLLALVYEKPMLRVRGMGSAGRVSLLHQAEKRRYILHLLYAPVHQRGAVQVVEEMPIIGGIDVDLEVAQRIKNVQVIAGDVEHACGEKNLALKVRSMQGHAAVVLEYA